MEFKAEFSGCYGARVIESQGGNFKIEMLKSDWLAVTNQIVASTGLNYEFCCWSTVEERGRDFLAFEIISDHRFI